MTSVKQAQLLHLFTNDVVPDAYSYQYDEPKEENYAPIEMGFEEWRISEGDEAVARCQEKRFEKLISKVFGYFISNLRGEILWAERFPSPFEKPDWAEDFSIEIGPCLRFTQEGIKEEWNV